MIFQKWTQRTRSADLAAIPDAGKLAMRCCKKAAVPQRNDGLSDCDGCIRNVDF